MNIIDRIVELMNKQGVSKKDLLKLTGLSKSTFYYLFSDTINENKISLETIRPIAKALNTTLDYLIFGEDEKKPDNKLTGLKLEFALNNVGISFDDLDKLSDEQAGLIASTLKNFLKNKADD